MVARPGAARESRLVGSAGRSGPRPPAQAVVRGARRHRWD